MSYSANLTTAMMKLRNALANGLSGLLINDTEVAAILHYYDNDETILSHAREFFLNHPEDQFSSEQVLDELKNDTLDKYQEERSK